MFVSDVRVRMSLASNLLCRTWIASVRLAPDRATSMTLKHDYFYLL
jgi:hypothetical protein